MKGFGIEIKNNLLEKKHIEAMGTAVWLYMWCIDKMTSIGEDGVGKVLGGKPIKYEVDVRDDLGVPLRTYRRWVKILTDTGYINVIRTPYGLSLRVNKAFKRFGKKTSDVPKSVKRYATNGTSNIRHNKDSKQVMKTSTKFSTLNSKQRSTKRMDDVNYNIDDDGNEVTHNSWGRPIGKKKEKKEGKNKVALRVVHKFGDLCVKQGLPRPVANVVSYKMALFALNTGKLTEEQVYDLFDEWFKLGKADEETVSIGRALSANQINGYKVRNNVE